MNVKIQDQYPLIIKLIHWLSFIFVAILFPLGLWMVDLDYYSEWYQTAPAWHKNIGVLLILLTVLRIAVRATQGVPKPSVPVGLKLVAVKLIHYLFYIILLVLFISGYLITTGEGESLLVFSAISIPAITESLDQQIDLIGTIHYWAALLLVSLIVLHAGAALKHHFLDRDETLLRMISFKRKKSTS